MKDSRAWGFSIIFGRPFSPRLADWHAALMCRSDLIEWYPPANLHATIVNCTPPAGRSADRGAVLRTAADLRLKLRDRLPSCLRELSPFEFAFERPEWSGNSVIVQTQPHPTIAKLKMDLQGGQPWIDRADAIRQLERDRVLGIDKYSSSRASLARNVAITLGKRAGAVAPAEDRWREIPAPAAEPANHVRLVCYGDRQLDDVVASAELGFGEPCHSLGSKLDDFFADLGRKP